MQMALHPRGVGATHAEAVARFERLLPEASVLARYQFLLGYAFRMMGQRVDDALAACREASGLQPEAGWPHHFLSTLHGWFTGDFAQAYEEAARAVELAPGTHMFRYQLGVAAYQAGKVEGALAHLAEAVKRSAAFGQAHLAWIWILALEGRADEAVAHYEARVADHPSANDRTCLGVALLRAGRPEDAAEILAGVWREDPGMVGAASWLAIAYYRAGRAEEAVPVLEDAIRRRPVAAQGGAYSLLADLHLRRGEPEQARAVYLAALRQGGNATSYNERHVAFAAACCEAPAEAQAWCEAHFPSLGGLAPAHIRCGIGEALFARGDPPAAIARMEEALQLAPLYPFLRMLLAQAYLVRGDLASARRVLPQPLLERAGLRRFLDWEEARFAEVVAEIESTRGSGINAAQGLGLEDRVAQMRSGMTRSERLAAWAKRLDALHEHADAIRAGIWGADSARDALDAAEFARCSGAYAQATKYFRQAFESYLREFRWEGLRVRFRAARAAVRAAAAEGVDAETRQSLHASARGWLRDELVEWRERLAERPPRGRSGVSVLDPELWHWKFHVDLASVRDADALAKLPVEEREAWEALWTEVDEVLATQR
jgi:tetratricopeptide (TPR) repeat protein